MKDLKHIISHKVNALFGVDLIKKRVFLTIF